ncbi:MAG: DNA gyrase/topoisomerase IV subunit A [Bacillota bacterium]
MAKGSNQMTIGENIVEMSMEEVMHRSMMPYAEYVILERALPRVEDGLKPVQRRILYTMMELGLTPDKPHRKSARIVGDTLGKYHPHGDTSVYDAMVRMAQEYNMRAPLVDGHGNFGSVDGDPAAAMRYTEARLTPISLELLRDIDKDTVSFGLNFDDSLKEPDMLPGRYPNLLVNGASGIAVGLATNIPPHNLGEAIDSVVARLDNPLCSLEDVMQYMPCPDFPTGGELIKSGEILQAYSTGRGRLTLRARTKIEHDKNGKSRIVVYELPYQVNKAAMLEKVLKVSEEKKALFAGIADIRDESDREGMRAVIELKKDADPEKMLQCLYKYTDLQVTFGVNMVAIADGKPCTLSLLELIDHYIAHQRRVVLNRTRYDLEAAKRRAHILVGLLAALDDIDRAIAIIRGSQKVEEARQGLMDAFRLDREQAQAILDMRLQRLTGLERLNLQNEYKKLEAAIKRLEGIIKSEKKLVAVIREELLEIKEKYADARRTRLIEADTVRSLPEEPETIEDVWVTLSRQGVVRRYAADPKNGQRNGDAILQTVACTTKDQLHIFTSMGNVFLLPCAQVPEAKGKEKGVSIFSLLQGLQNGEKPVCMLHLPDGEGELLFFTRGGMVKRTGVSEYIIKKARAQALVLKDGDELLSVQRRSEDDTILLLSAQGMSIRFKTEQVSLTGRVSAGVRGIALENGDHVMLAAQTCEEGEVLVLTDSGYAKRSLIFDYEPQNRNGKGQKTIDFKKNGVNGRMIVAAFYVTVPFIVEAQYSDGAKERFNTDEVRIEKRFSKGSVLLPVAGDNSITAAYAVLETDGNGR